MNIEELKHLIAATLTPDEILDILGWSTFELVEALEEEIKINSEDFKSAII